MKRYGNLFDLLLGDKLLTDAFNRAKKNKLKMKNVQRVMLDPKKHIEGVKALLLADKVKTSAFHNKFIFEPKLRLIYALPFYPDRIIHHALMLILEPIWEGLMYKHSYACRKGKGQHTASLQCLKWVKKYKYCAQLDISQFYINIDHEILKQVFRQKIKDKRFLAILDENVDAMNIRANNIKIYQSLIAQNIATEQAEIGLAKLEKASKLNNDRPSGVAVGSLTSQWFGNLYMTGFDLFVTETLKHPAYIRFCDDLLLFADDKKYLHDLVSKCEEWLLKERRLTLSKSRLYPTSHGVDFCGYRHFPNGVILLRKRTAKATKKRMNGLMYELKHGYITKDQAVSKIASAEGWLKHAKTYNLRKSMGLEQLKKEVTMYETV